MVRENQNLQISTTFSADYLHEIHLELNFNEKLQLLELAIFINRREMIKTLLNDFTRQISSMHHRDRVHLALSIIHYRQKSIRGIY